MSFFSNLSLQARFLITPIMGVVLLTAVYFFNYLIETSHTALFHQLNETNLPRVGEVSSIIIELSNNHNKLNSLLVTAAKELDEEKIYIEGKEVLNNLYEIEEKVTEYISSGKEIQVDGVNVREGIALAFSQYRLTILKAIEMSSVNANFAQQELLFANDQLLEVNNLFLILSDVNINALSASAESVNDSLSNQNVFSILTIVLIVFMLVLAFYFSAHLSSGLVRINKAMIKLSDGSGINDPPLETEGYLQPLSFAVDEFRKTLVENEEHKSVLRDNEERYLSLLELTPAAIVSFDESQNIILFNREAEQTFGYSSDEIIGQPITLLIDVESVRGYSNQVDFIAYLEAESHGVTSRESLKALRKTGENFHVEVSFSSMQQHDSKILTAAITDVTERLEDEKKIQYQAHYDALTDLPNRFLSLDRLSHLIKESKRNSTLIAILFVDLDDFKKINDTLGHDVGDKVLIEVASRLKGLVREPDTVGRLGGDEFIVLLGGIDNAESMHQIAEKVVQSFRSPFFIEDREFILTLSVGVSIFPNDGGSMEELLRKSDAAMYQSKSKGRNSSTFFTEEMNQNLNRRLQIEEQMAGALGRNEFAVYYQPRINLVSGEIMGAEALLRWANPMLGNVPPDEFIPLAEQTGMIVEIGDYVMNEALSVTARWHKEYNANFSMAINVSPRQFRECDLFHGIEKAMEKHQVEAKHFEIEITEGLFMSGGTRTTETLLKMSEQGIGIGMDDFGTGFSSLSYLRNYPFSVLKIDRSFINDITTDSKDKELVNAAVAMAHGLKLKVVAEGVETKGQLLMLKAMGCDIGQGYLFSRPVPELEFIELFEADFLYDLIENNIN